VGKGIIASIVHGDEISLGERFCSRIAPRLHSFIEWSLMGAEMLPEYVDDINRIKTLSGFSELIRLDETSMLQLGVKSDVLRANVLKSIRKWTEKFRFPAYRFEVLSMAVRAMMDVVGADDSGNQ
jgi:hypothetical protein